MEDNGGVKVRGIKQIVKLKEMLQKWQNVALSPKANKNNDSNNNINNGEEGHMSLFDQIHGGISSAISKRIRNTNANCDSDKDSCYSHDPPFDVPKGYLAVYVGPEVHLRRFIIPTTYLTHPLFKVLLEKVEEEFGFNHSGGLTIPCEVETFKYLLKCMETRENDQHPQLDHKTAGTSITAGEYTTSGIVLLDAVY